MDGASFLASFSSPSGGAPSAASNAKGDANGNKPAASDVVYTFSQDIDSFPISKAHKEVTIVPFATGEHNVVSRRWSQNVNPVCCIKIVYRVLQSCT